MTRFLDPKHANALKSIDWYEEQLEKQGFEHSDMRKNIPALINRRPPGYNEKEREVYEALCRGEVPVVRKNFC